jgi:uncharacterized protein
VQKPLAIGAAVVLLVGLIVKMPWGVGMFGHAAAQRLAAPYKALLRKPNFASLVGLGFLNGLLPCGTVYLALVGAVATSGVAEAGLFMVFFGMGTLPSMLGVGYASGWLTQGLRGRLRWGLPASTLLVAAWLLWRGFAVTVQAPVAAKKGASKGETVVCCHK